MAYADDTVLLAPSWRALQILINLLYKCALDMTCNAAKTVCVAYDPKHTKMIIDTDFHNFTLNGVPLQYVKQFNNLGHIMKNDCCDDDDIKREIRNHFMGSNILVLRYSKCSFGVKLTLFEAYCMCLFDAGIWLHYSTTLNKSFSLLIYFFVVQFANATSSTSI